MIAVILSVLISIITILFPDTPNDDAYVYIKTAEIFLAEGTLPHSNITLGLATHY